MFKKSKWALIVSNLILITSISTGIGIVGVSCYNDSNSKKTSNDAFECYKEFVYGTHGRWAGNYANYILSKDNDRSSDISNHTFGQYGLDPKNLQKAGYIIKDKKTDIKFTHPFNPNVQLKETDIDGIGSHYAFEWLVNKIKSFNLKDNGNKYSITNGNPFNYPDEASVELNIDGTVKNVIKGKNAKFADTAEGEKNAVSIFAEPNNEPVFQKTGFITQGFLWNAKDRITNKSVANQYSQNIVVTIKALNDEGKEKFTPLTIESKGKEIERSSFWLTAHYDSTGTEGINSKSWGATDNGSGVAGLLDLIKYYSKSDNAKKLQCDLNIAFVGGEEVGVMGSTALVNQYMIGDDGFNSIVRKQIGGMINIDTSAGGDFVYVHSPWTQKFETKNGKVVVSEEKQDSVAATNTLIRDQLNSISKMQADKLFDQNSVLQIHPFITPVPGAEGYLQGQTGDWSDHSSFYKLGISNIAYIETTNFQINGNSGYDGYSQVINSSVWLYKKQFFDKEQWNDCKDEKGNLITKPGTPIKTKLDGTDINVWGPGEHDFDSFKENNKIYRWSRYNSGAIWHWNYDRPQFMQEIFRNRVKEQLTSVGNTLRTFFRTLNIGTFNSELNGLNSSTLLNIDFLENNMPLFKQVKFAQVTQYISKNENKLKTIK